MYENPNGVSLTKIYNKGLSESTNDIVVFCHDDIIFNKKKCYLTKSTASFMKI